MTAKQSIPEAFRRIVEIDRELGPMARLSVVPLSDFRSLSQERRRRVREARVICKPTKGGTLG